jgi:hypothetical protein
MLPLAAAPSADAELAQKGDLFVKFDGGISPQALPRQALAPIAVRIEGTIRAPARRRPPALRRIRIALNRGGRIGSRGLPVCHRQQIDPSSSAEALAICGPALIGGGGFTARTALPDQASTVLPGEILLFNTVVDGRRAILAHVFHRRPAPSTYFILFTIQRTPGTLGTVITGDLPYSLNRNGYLKSVYLQIQRRYAFGGRMRSYLNASCPAPAGFPGALFPFARVSMAFEDGRTLASTLIRSCSVL